jgi:hypothetical protein
MISHLLTVTMTVYTNKARSETHKSQSRQTLQS